MSAALMILAVLVVGPLAAAAVAPFRRDLVRALPFLVAMNGLGIPVNGLTVRLDQLAALLLTGALLAAVAMGRRRFVADRAMLLLVLLLAANVVATAANSPARGYSLGQIANVLSVWCVYVVVVNFLDTREGLDEFFRLFMIAGLVETAIGIVAFVLAAAGLPNGGANLGADNTTALGVSGTMFEPNLFGNYCQIYLVIALGLILAARDRGERAPRLAVWVASTSALGLAFSFTRGAWLGAAFGVAVLLVLATRQLKVKVPARAIAFTVSALAMAGLVFAFMPGRSAEYFRYKMLNLINPQSENATVRLASYGLALSQYVEHPVIGTGTYSFAALAAGSTEFRQFEGWRNLWIGNYLLLALHDTGVIGLLLLTALLGWLWRSGARVVRVLVPHEPAAARRQVALVAAFAGTLVSFLFSSGLTLGYPWLLMGIIGAQVRLGRDA